MNFSEEVEAMDVLMAEDSVATNDFAGAEDLDVSVSSEAVADEKVLDSVAPDYMGEIQEVLTDGAAPEFAEDVVLLADSGKKEAPKPSRLDNILTLSLVAALVLAIVAIVLRKIRADKKPAPVVAEEIPSTPAAETPE